MRQLQRKKLTWILPETAKYITNLTTKMLLLTIEQANQDGDFSKNKEVATKQNKPRSKQKKSEDTPASKEKINKDTYNPTTTSLLQSSELYVSELMRMQNIIEYIELKGQHEVVKLKESLEVSQKLER